MKMKIKKVGEYDFVEIPSSNLDEFKEEWERQGGTILEHKDIEMTVKNKDGKVIHLFVIDNTIFPFDYGDE